ncbi:PLP-dependent transferase, partial [Escherichia coli]|uniref:PLP-dependent transferase n=1 Tax=Escherichia coli TaxID=562 RepID=UPI001EE0B4CC
RFLENVRIFSLAESLGGVESLIEHPAIMTHASIPAETRADLGIGDSLIRLSVGVEALEDLQADLAQMNQQGSGTLEHKAAPKTTEVAPFQDNQVKKVAPPATPKQARSEEAPKAAVTTTRQRQQKAPSKTQAQKAEQVAKPA